MTDLLKPGPLVGDQLLAVWPRLKPFVVAAFARQDPGVAQLLLDIVSAEPSRLTFTVAGLKLVVAVADKPIAAVPVIALVERGLNAAN